MTDNYMYGKEVAEKMSQGDQESSMPEEILINNHYAETGDTEWLGGDDWQDDMVQTPYVRRDIHDKLQAENERLRSALEDAAWSLDNSPDAFVEGSPTWSDRWDRRWRALDKAQQALKGNADDE